MEYKLNDMKQWERRKAIYLLGVAEDLGMNTAGYGELAVNPTSGYTYLWLEDYAFTLYMPVIAELREEDVYAMWTSPYDGEEKEIQVGNKKLKDLEQWAQELSDEDEKING